MKPLKTLMVGLLLAASLITSSVVAAPAPVVQPEAVIAVTPKPLSIQEKIDAAAKRYGVQSTLMRSVIKCESTFNPKAVGDNGTSFGLVQIHLPSHPTITKEQAFDEDFAIDFLASNLAKGKGNMWTCYRIVTGQQ